MWAGEPIPEEQQKKMEGKRVWARPPVQGFAVDIGRCAWGPRCLFNTHLGGASMAHRYMSLSDVMEFDCALECYVLYCSDDDDSPRAATPSPQPLNGSTQQKSPPVDAWELLKAGGRQLLHAAPVWKRRAHC
jgi:hypothetical protein